MKYSTIFKVIALNLFLLTLTASGTSITTFIDLASANAWSQSGPSMELGDTLFIRIKDGDYNFVLTTIPGGAATYSTPTNPNNVGNYFFVPTVLGTYNYNSVFSGASGSFIVNPATPSIRTGIISSLAICSGGTLTIPFTYRSTITGFSAQLSNTSGSFSTPIALTTITVTGSYISVTVPINIASGTGYRIRVNGASPATTGTANLQDISVNITTPAPEISVNINPQGAVCTTNSVTHTGSALYLDGATYSWYVNNTSAAGTNQFIKNNFQNNDRAYVVVTGTAGGCTPTPFSTTLVGNVMTVSSTVVPTLSITDSPSDAICFGTDVTITGIPSGGGIDPAYQLNLTGTYTSTTTSGSNFILKGARNGVTATLIMVSQLSCVSENVKTVTSNTLVINSLPSTPTITGVPCTGSGCLTSLAANSLPGVTYQWYKSNALINGATGSLFTPTITGSYKVSLSNGSCSYTSAGFNITVTGVINTTTGIADATENRKISLYPNPVVNKLFVAAESDVKTGALLISIYDLNQKVVLNQALGNTNLNGIDVSGLSAGLYIVHITDGSTILLSKKLVKQ